MQRATLVTEEMSEAHNHVNITSRLQMYADKWGIKNVSAR